MPLWLEIIFIVFLVLLNGVLALSEIAVVSSRKPRLQHLAERGNLRAKAALDLANHPDLFLSTVQAGITLVGVLAGAFGGVTLSEHVSRWIAQIPILADYNDAVGLLLVVVTITYLSATVGELIPKQLALRNPERVAMIVAFPMKTMSVAFHPIVTFLSFSSRAFFKLLGIGASTNPAVTEEEIKVMLEEGTKAGTFNELEQEMVERVFRLGDRRSNALMTPRTDIIWIDTEDPMEENLRKITQSSHSFFPVCKGGIEHILGVVHVKDLLSQYLSGAAVDFRSAVRQPLYVVENMPVVELIEQFKKTGVHFAFLVDEYGGIQGLVTLNDILKAVVGQEIAAADEPNPYVVQRADGSYLIDGALLIDEFKELFQIDALSEEETANYQTVAGFVINQMGKIPAAGQYFVWKDLMIEVVDMDDNRVDKLLISRIPKATPA